MSGKEVETITRKLIEFCDEYDTTSHDYAWLRREWPKEAVRFPPADERMEWHNARQALIQDVPKLCRQLLAIIDPPPIALTGRLMALVSRAEGRGRDGGPFVPGESWAVLRDELRGLSLAVPFTRPTQQPLTPQQPTESLGDSEHTEGARPPHRPWLEADVVHHRLRLRRDYEASGLTIKDFIRQRGLEPKAYYEITVGGKYAKQGRDR